MYDPKWREENGFDGFDGTDDKIIEDDGGYVGSADESKFSGHVGGS